MLVYYYQCYDEKGKRQWAKSTGLTKKTEATAYCMKLFRDGLLIPEQKTPLFAEFSNGWWDAESRYMKWRQLHDPITPGTILLHTSNFNNHIKDYFGKFRLDEITPYCIEEWLFSLTEKGIKASTANLQFRTLKVMLAEAVRTKLIKDNPCSAVKELKAEETERKILTVEEVRKLFPKDWSTVWESVMDYKVNKLAACTGLRIGELRGLRGDLVFDDYICISGQYGNFGYVPHTKTKQNRNIPLTPIMRGELEDLIQANGDGYVFSEDGGKTPITCHRIYYQLSKALKNIGIEHDERRKRNLSFHAWRHFLNTLLRMSNVADSKVQQITGHKTMRMTDHYTHFDTRQFTEIRDAQAGLLTFQAPKLLKPKPSKLPKKPK
jgi:integrase